MRVTLWLDSRRSWTDLLELAKRAEQAGWDSLRVSDEPAGLECWAVLGALAEAAPTIGLQAVVSDSVGRHPAVIAKLASTVDQLSNGRLLLGLTPSERLAETCEVVKGLTNQQRTTFEGTYYQLSDAPLDPKPIQQPFPLMLIGTSPELAARYADHWSIQGTAKEIETQLTALTKACQQLGRNRNTITVSALWNGAEPLPDTDELVVRDTAREDLFQIREQTAARGERRRA